MQFFPPPSPPNLVNKVLESSLDQVFIICSSEPFFNPYKPPRPWKILPQHDATTTMLHCRDGVGQVMMLKNKAKKFNLGLYKPDNIVAHSLFFRYFFNCWDIRRLLLRKSFCPFPSRSVSLVRWPYQRRVLILSVFFRFWNDGSCCTLMKPQRSKKGLELSQDDQ